MAFEQALKDLARDWKSNISRISSVFRRRGLASIVSLYFKRSEGQN